MNDLLFFSLLVLALIRVLGFAVSLQLFLGMKKTKQTKQKKLGMITIGWLSWTISGIIRILGNLEVNQIFSELLFLVDNLLLAIGAYYICVGVISYFRFVKTNLVIKLNFFLIGVPIFLFIFVDLSTSLLFINIWLVVSYSTTFFLGLIERKNLRSYIGNSIIWFYCATVFITLFLFDVIYLSSKNALFDVNQRDVTSSLVYYLFSIGITLIVLVLLLHLENSLSTMDKNELKDRFSHDLGNLIQIIYSNIEMHETLCEELINVKLIKQKCKDAGDLINEIRSL